MELVTLSALFVSALVLLILIGWWLTHRLRAVEENSGNAQLLLLQQQIEQLRAQMSQSLDANAQTMQQQLGQILGSVNERLRENVEVLSQTQRTLGERLDNAARVVGHVQRSLGGLEEASRKIYEVGKDIASLQEILRAPKLRGGLGEFFLEDLLTQILPAQHFSTQHSFRSGDKVDAVIKLGSSLVPVDAKFPLENFKRMVEAETDEEKGRARKQFAADVRKQLFKRSQPVLISAGFLGLIGLVPGMPIVPFWLMAGGLLFVGRSISRTEQQTEVEEATKALEAAPIDMSSRMRFQAPSRFGCGAIRRS